MNRVWSVFLFLMVQLPTLNPLWKISKTVVLRNFDRIYLAEPILPVLLHWSDLKPSNSYSVPKDILMSKWPPAACCFQTLTFKWHSHDSDPNPTPLSSPGFLRCVDLRLERGLRSGSSRHMSEGRRGGAGRRQVKDHTDVGRGGVTSSVNVGRGGVTVWEICAVVWEICAVLAWVIVLMLGWEEEICKRRHPDITGLVLGPTLGSHLV